MGSGGVDNKVGTVSDSQLVNQARSDLHTQLVARLQTRERRRSTLLIAMTAPAAGLLSLIVYRFVINLA